MAGMAEAGIVENLLADRIGDHRRGEAGAHVAGGTGNRLDDALRVGRVGRADAR